MPHTAEQGAADSAPDRGRRPAGEVREAASGYFHELVFRLDPQLSDRLRLTAYARHRTPSALAAELLKRGLEREALRERAESALAILTPREREVARLAVVGHTNQEIARALVISPETVKTHMRNLLAKFGLGSKAELRLRLQELDQAP